MFVTPTFTYVLARVRHPLQRGIGVTHNSLPQVVPTVGHVQDIFIIRGAVQCLEEADPGCPLQ